MLSSLIPISQVTPQVPFNENRPETRLQKDPNNTALCTTVKPSRSASSWQVQLGTTEISLRTQSPPSAVSQSVAIYERFRIYCRAGCQDLIVPPRGWPVVRTSNTVTIWRVRDPCACNRHRRHYHVRHSRDRHSHCRHQLSPLSHFPPQSYSPTAKVFP